MLKQGFNIDSKQKISVKNVECKRDETPNSYVIGLWADVMSLLRTPL